MPFIKRAHLFQGLKIALGASAAIVLANLLGLQYSATAGIITVLSIMGTKGETLRIARGRLLAFLTALAIAFVCFTLLGFTWTAFTVYLFLFAVVCGAFKWMYATAMVSVLVSHFLSAGNMGLPMLANEALLFLIGTVCGILVNLHLRADDAAMQRQLTTVDELMRAALNALSRAPEGLSDAAALLPALSRELAAAEQLAANNADNTFGDAPLYPIRYVQMRANQRKILAQMHTAMQKIDALTPQHGAVCALLGRVAEEYHRDNDVSALLAALDEVLADMRTQALPVTREEFESRAVLYYVLLRLQDFLLLKRQFFAENPAGK